MALFRQKKDTEKEPTFPITRMKTVIDKYFEETKTQRDEMTRFLKRYKGEWWDKDVLKDTDSTIFANLFFSTVMTIAPLITDNRPIWSIRPRKPYLQNHFEGLSLGLEYAWDKLDLDMNCFKWILDALIMKIGIVKTWFDADSEFGGENRVEVVDPRMFFCAPGYDDIWDAPMCGTRIKKPLSWVRSKYPETGKDVKPDPSSSGQDEVVNDNAATWEMENKYATVYEVWFKDEASEKYFVDESGKEVAKEAPGAQEARRPSYPNGRIVIFTRDALLEDKASVYQHGKPPYVALYDYLVPHELIGMGEGNQIEELNKSYNRNLQLLDNYTKYRCDPPLFIDSNVGVDIEDLKARIPQGGAVFAANLAAMPAGKPIVVGDVGMMDQTVLQYMSGLTKVVEEISGVTDITKGMTTKSQRQSATEISTLIESAYTRTRQRVRNFEWSVKRLLYLLLCNMQQFYTEPRDISLQRDNELQYFKIGSSNAQVKQSIGTPNAIAQQMGQEPFNDEDTDQQITKDYERFVEDFGDADPVYAEFDLLIETNSSLPMDKQSLANLFLRLLEMAGGNPVTGMPMWEAALSALRIPRYKEIIDKMNELFKQQNQPPAAPPEIGGMPGLGQMMAQGAGQ